MIVTFISILASFAAFAGGMVALRFKDHLHVILGLSAGAVIGAALFDLIPEAIEIVSATGLNAAEHTLLLVALGFFAYLILDRIFSFHVHTGDEHDGHDADHHAPQPRGYLGAASFCVHSLIDGIAVGLAFQASVSIGLIVAIAVIAHRFSDGINTVGVILRHRGTDANAWKWLIAVALAPIVGTLSTFLFSVSETVLAGILSIFAGFFLYIGASDLIPEGHHAHAKGLTTVMTLVGAIAMFIIIQIAHA